MKLAEIPHFDPLSPWRARHTGGKLIVEGVVGGRWWRARHTGGKLIVEGVVGGRWAPRLTHFTTRPDMGSLLRGLGWKPVWSHPRGRHVSLTSKSQHDARRFGWFLLPDVGPKGSGWVHSWRGCKKRGDKPPPRAQGS